MLIILDKKMQRDRLNKILARPQDKLKNYEREYLKDWLLKEKLEYEARYGE